MRRLTKRFESVNVATLSTLREFLEAISTPESRFQIEKVVRDRVTIRNESFASGKRVRSSVVLPAYPTGHPDDLPANVNVVLDPLEFVNADTHEARHVFTPLLGHEVLVHFEKMHPSGELPMSRCC